MLLTKDMKDLILLFKKHRVRYMLVGGFAVNYYGYVRMTQDIDFLIFPSKTNAEKVIRVLHEFGFGEAGIPREYFEKGGSAVHLGVEPNRIDLLTKLKGVSNDNLFSNAKRAVIDGIGVKMISLRDLIATKKKSDRLRDQADADELRRQN